MLSILHNREYIRCETHYKLWLNEVWSSYENVLCCKPVGRITKRVVDVAFSKLDEVCTIKETLDEIHQQSRINICCLPKGHSGKCSYTFYKKLFKNQNISNKLDWLLSTPGNNDFIFKNRHTRLFPIRLSDEMEKSLRNKDKKLKCAIPLKDSSNPEMIASAILDFLTLIFNVKDIDTYIDIKNEYYQCIQKIVKNHKKNMIDYYKNYNRILFDNNGHTICPITGQTLDINDFFLKLDHPNAIQLGHVEPRCCDTYTIRGRNVLLMSRDGNRIIGDNSFLENSWLTKLKKIVDFHQ